MDLSRFPVAFRTGYSSLVQVPAHERTLPLKVGTRGSPLAITQTRNFIAKLQKICPALNGLNTEELIIRTT
ncbi:MAG: hypothetical protein POG24_11385, partial [Acidocella sp.]|nr:hypothetical protein [Acidocella sp.]